MPHTTHVLGWREWVGLPELGIDRLKCKVDTGARSSALHAYFVEPFSENGRARVRFGIHPLQRRSKPEIVCVADVLDERMVSDSGGHRENRIVIATPIVLGASSWAVEITLTDRDTMRFRMLLGRTAINCRYVVDPSASYLAGKPQLSNTSS
ncbi:MAG: RimK/LysX family protein [Gammaproteobacteria bacterium]|nr:RimK/LysX family protein [Gammaproteobacteria bacterium]